MKQNLENLTKLIANKMEALDRTNTMTLKDLEKNIRTMIPDIQHAAEKPAVNNPFVSKMEFSVWDNIQYFTVGLILIPLRLLLTFLAFLLASFLSKLCLIGYIESDTPEPFTGIRRYVQYFVWFLARFLIFMYGFWHVPTKGKLADVKKAPIVVVAPHTSFFDGLLLGTLGTIFSAVGRHENNNIFLIGSIIQVIQPLTVNRTQKNSKQRVIKEIDRRVKGDWPRLVIFPEGTTTNHQAFVTFKPGAFYPGLPVQPILLKFKDKLDYVSWTWMSPSTRNIMFAMMSRLVNRAEVEILPVYEPSQEEIEDPFLYARNVRDYMGRAADIPVTDHSYEDCRLMEKAKSLGLPMDSGLVEYYKLSPMIGMNCDCMMDYLTKFSEIDTSKDGVLDLDEFCNYLHLPSSEEVKTIFRIYDIDKDNAITFREYLLGFTLISRPFNTEENIKTAFELFDSDNEDCITYDNFITPIQTVLQVDEKYLELIYKDVDLKENGKVVFEDFRAFCLNKPEYALLFIHFRRLREQNSSMTYSKAELRRTSVNEADEDIINSVPIPNVEV